MIVKNGNRAARNDFTKQTIADKKTCKLTVSLMHVWLRYLTVFAKFELQVKVHTIVKGDEKSIAAAMRRVIEVKEGGNI